MCSGRLRSAHRVAEKAHPALGVADRQQQAAKLGSGDEDTEEEGEPEHQHADQVEAEAGRGRLQVEAQEVLEVGQPVVAAEAHVVPEERQHQREGHRLGDDREIDASDARAEGEPAEHEGERARHQDRQQEREGEGIEAPPVPGQFLPIEEHHEVGQQGMA